MPADSASDLCQQTLCFAGKVKDADIARYPPYGVVSTQFLTNQLGQRMIPKKGGVRATEPNARAKGGFEYWYKEPKQKYISGKLLTNHSGL